MKTPIQIPTAYLDIVFAGRNKSYGAYELRNNYTNSLKKAMSIIFSICAIITLFAFTNKPKSSIIACPVITPITISDLKVVPKPIVKVIPKPKVVTPPKPNILKTIIDAKNIAVVKVLPVTPIVPKVPGIAIAKVPDGPIASGPVTTPGLPTGPVTKSGLPDGPATIKPGPTESGNVVLDVNPSYPGGEAALKQFLETHLQYPEDALSAGIEGRLRIAFQINEKGELSAVRIINKIGGGCEEEAKRVLKLMPKWIPGIYNGKPISSEWEIPMSFKLN
jgi:periplasmic protein TonB